MNLDDQLDDYFSKRSSSVDLGDTPLAAVTRRGRRRHHRRTAMCGGAVIAAFAIAGVTAAQLVKDDPPHEVTTAAPVDGTTPSTLQWSEVTNPGGDVISNGSGAVTGTDGTVYAISTSPDDRGLATSSHPVIWSTRDGADWSSVGPADFRATGLAAGSDRIYAVGTSPSGGGYSVNLRTQTAGSADWATTEVPLDLAALSADVGRKQGASTAAVATSGATVVVAVSVGPVNYPQPAELVPGSTPEAFVESMSSTGATITSITCGDANPVATSGPDAPPVTDGSQPDVTVSESSACQTHEQRTWSWADLGISDDQIAGLIGQTRYYTSVDGAPFEFTSATLGSPATGAYGPSTIVGAEDGIWRFDQHDGALAAAVTTDGRTWTDVPVQRGAEVVATGTVDGHAAFISSTGERTNGSLWIADAQGGRTIDLGAALNGRMMVDASFGPMGLAILAGTYTDSAPPTYQVLHTSDMATWQSVDVPLTERQSPNGLTVTADAITVRISDRTGIPVDDLGQHPSTMRLFVGTPR